MSLRGRYFIDRIKKRLGPRIFDCRFHPMAIPNIGIRAIPVWAHKIPLNGDKSVWIRFGNINTNGGGGGGGATNQLLTTTLANTIGIQPHADSDEPILMLGCGNSRLGEEMMERGWRGPLIQVDVSHRVIDSMSQRCRDYIQQGHMNFIQDDATELSALHNAMMQACLDKGLIDALFCADEYDQCQRVIKAVHRVLKPGGIFCVWSFSQPAFLLPKIIDSTNNLRQAKTMWEEIQIHELSKILLYRFQKKKVDDATNIRLSSPRPRR